MRPSIVSPMPSRLRRLATILLLPALVGACDQSCITPGYPAVRLSVRDAVSGAPVAVSYAELVQVVATGEQPTRRAREDMLYPAVGELAVCCVPTPVQLRLRVPGYAVWDGTVEYRRQGRCGVPVPARVEVRLRRLATATR